MAETPHAPPNPFLAQCVSFDLEVDPKTARVQAFAAVRHTDKDALVYRNGGLGRALDQLDQCAHRTEQTPSRLNNPQLGWPMAYALSWTTVASGASVMPPWVRAQFRKASLIVRRLRENCARRKKQGFERDSTGG